MSDATQAKAAGTPWHLWVVGVVGLLWNGYGCYDYYMTETGGEEYLRSYGMTDEMIAYYAAMPAWMTAVWAIGVWGALLGTILLLMRIKWAMHVFVISCAAYIFSLIYTYALSGGAPGMPPEAPIMHAVVFAACVFFIWYAWFATKRGILR
jgi:hypothetical protein